jgi:hypothetical protein
MIRKTLDKFETLKANFQKWTAITDDLEFKKQRKGMPLFQLDHLI